MSLQENEVPNRLSAFKHKGKDLEVSVREVLIILILLFV